MGKTYKRETALSVLLYLFYLGLYGRVEIVEILAWPMMLFIGTAFGMEWASRQTNLGVTSKDRNNVDAK